MNTLGLASRPEESRDFSQGNSGSFHEGDFATIFRDHVQILWRQKMVISATVVIIMILAYIILSSLVPRYTAYTLVEINPRQTRVVNFDSVLSGLPADLETIQTEIKIVQSRRLAGRVVENLKLIRNPEFNLALQPKGLIASWREAMAAWFAGFAEEASDSQGAQAAQNSPEANQLSALFDWLILNLAGIIRPATKDGSPIKDPADQETDQVVSLFLQHLKVEPEGRSRIIRISFESKDPNTAAAAANAVADYYIVAQLEAKFEATKRAVTWLNQRVEKLRDEVVEKERTIEEYRAKAGLLQGGRQITLSSEQVSNLNAQYIQELARLAEARARLRQANELLKSPTSSGIESAVDVLQSQLIRDLRTSEATLERQIAELSEQYGSQHPKMINARAELNDLRNKIKVEVDRVIQGLNNEVAVAKARADSLKHSLEDAKSEVAENNQLEVDLRALERDANASRTLLENMLQRNKEAASEETFQQADAHVVSEAVAPAGPSYPRKGLGLFLSFLGALGFAVPLAIISDKLDFGFRSTEQISHYLHVRPLGLLPRVPKITAMGKAPHDYVLANPQSSFCEGIRTLYTNIILSDVTNRPKVVLLTSALPGEGKTTVALSLGRLMTMSGYRTIVVDCDLRRPHVHKRLGLEQELGLVDCLSSGAALEDVIQEDKESGAHILSAGKTIYNSPEMLDSAQMQQLLRSLAKKYDLVVLDSAPLLAVSDTLFVSRLADKTVFLVRWGQTRRAVATMALEQLLTAKAEVAGVLLTLVDVKANAKYGYGDAESYRGRLKKYYMN